MGIQAGADGRASQGDFLQSVLRPLRADQRQLDLAGVSAELLAQADRRGILQMGAPDLDDLVEGARLGVERPVQPLQGRHQLPLDHLDRRDMNGGRDHVVAGLTLVHLVVGMHQLAAARAAQQLRRTVRNHLVRIHVGGGAGAGLENVHREFGVPFPVNHLAGGFADGVGGFLFERAQRMVHAGRGVFYETHGSDERSGKAQVADREVFNGAGGLDAIVGIGRYGQFAHRVAFDAGGAGRSDGLAWYALLHMCVAPPARVRRASYPQGGRADKPKKRAYLSAGPLMSHRLFKDCQKVQKVRHVFFAVIKSLKS